MAKSNGARVTQAGITFRRVGALHDSDRIRKLWIHDVHCRTIDWNDTTSGIYTDRRYFSESGWQRPFVYHTPNVLATHSLDNRDNSRSYLAGNRMVGFDQITGQQVSVDFVGNGTPGTTTTDTKTLTGKFSSIDLIPAANDYVSYDAEVVLEPPKPPCPPTGDPVFDSTAVRDTTIGVYEATVRDGTEFMTAVYKNPFRIMTPANQVRKECNIDSWDWPTPAGVLDSNLIALIHPHVVSAGQPDPCNGNRPYDVTVNNGLSGNDMKHWFDMTAARITAGLDPFGMYVIDNDRIWLNPPPNFTPNMGTNRSVARVPTNCTWR